MQRFRSTRVFARLGSTLAAVTVLAGVTAGVASAAPASFPATVHHSSGALAASATGNLSWSSSLKTVTVTNGKIFVKGGEHVYVYFIGFQGANPVTPSYRFPASGFYQPATNQTYTLPTFSLTAGVPGGVQDVFITVNDDEHVITGYADCYQVASSCETGQY